MRIGDYIQQKGMASGGCHPFLVGWIECLLATDGVVNGWCVMYSIALHMLSDNAV